MDRSPTVFDVLRRRVLAPLALTLTATGCVQAPPAPGSPAAPSAAAPAVASAPAAPAAAPALPPSVVALGAAATRQVPMLDVAGLEAAIGGGRAGLLVDVREPDEYAAGHLPGAINIPRGTIEIAIWPRVGGASTPDLARPITLYCGTGLRCALAARSLRELGFTAVSAVEMRFPADWVKAGLPIERSPDPVWVVARELRLPVPAPAVWATVRPFDRLHVWHPTMASTRMDGDPSRPGAVRELTTKSGAVVREELLSLADAAMTVQYRILESPLPARDVIATLRVIPVAEGSLVVWSSSFRPRGEAKQAPTRAAVASIYEAGLKGLGETVR
ncbi:MAG: SRPBCC family protein [Burkholderiales bacterium]